MSRSEKCAFFNMRHIFKMHKRDKKKQTNSRSFVSLLWWGKVLVFLLPFWVVLRSLPSFVGGLACLPSFGVILLPSSFFRMCFFQLYFSQFYMLVVSRKQCKFNSRFESFFENSYTRVSFQHDACLERLRVSIERGNGTSSCLNGILLSLCQ